MNKRIESGDLDWRTDEDGNNGVQLQVDGNDVVSITDVMTDGKAHIIVWASSHPDSVIAWEGTINVRERQADEDDDPWALTHDQPDDYEEWQRQVYDGDTILSFADWFANRQEDSDA